MPDVGRFEGRAEVLRYGRLLTDDPTYPGRQHWIGQSLVEGDSEQCQVRSYGMVTGRSKEASARYARLATTPIDWRKSTATGASATGFGSAGAAISWRAFSTMSSPLNRRTALKWLVRGCRPRARRRVCARASHPGAVPPTAVPPPPAPWRRPPTSVPATAKLPRRRPRRRRRRRHAALCHADRAHVAGHAHYSGGAVRQRLPGLRHAHRLRRRSHAEAAPRGELGRQLRLQADQAEPAQRRAVPRRPRIHQRRRQVELSPHARPKNNSLLGAYSKLIADIGTPDKSTVLLTFDQPRGIFDLFAWANMQQLETLEGPDPDPGGRHRSVQAGGVSPGQSMSFSRNPSYWDSGKPYVDELQFTFTRTARRASCSSRPCNGRDDVPARAR